MDSDEVLIVANQKIPVGEIADGLRDDGVWTAPQAAGQREPLLKLVARADNDGHNLHVVIIEQDLKETSYRDIATTLQGEVGGTVLVFGPGGGRGAASDEFSRVELEDGANWGAGKYNTVAGKATHIYARAVDPYVDWTVVTIALVIAVVVGAVVGRWNQLRRRSLSAESPAAAPQPDATEPDPTAEPADDADPSAPGSDTAGSDTAGPGTGASGTTNGS